MSKLIKVILEYEDRALFIAGEQLEKWEKHNRSLSTLAMVHGMNPFDHDPVIWSVKKENE